MTTRDISIEDHEALLATHESRKLMMQVIERLRYPASARDEAVGGMRATGVLVVFALAAIVAALIPIGAAIVRHAPALYASALPVVHQVIGWL
jgi:hypothetical protein